MITEAGIIHAEKQKLNRAEWPWWILLLLIVALLWCTAYNRWTANAWKTPITYTGDAWAAMGIAKAFASGEVKSILPKYPASLGAPFVADWNDYPPAEGLFAWYGLLARLFGIFTGSNLTVLSAHLLAAGSFYAVARMLGYQRMLSVAGAVLFSMSRFAFARNLSHLGPLFYWHVPLGLIVAWWCGGSRPLLNDRKKILLCIGVAVLHGIQDPYYSGIFLQFLVLASLLCFIRREQWSKIMFPLFLAVLVLATHVLMTVDLFYAKLINGANTEAFVRTYAGLELYALKPLELFLPFPHRFQPLYDWIHKVYYTQAYFLGEIGSSYLGIIGIGALGALGWSTVNAAINRGSSSVPLHFWGVLWILFYSVVGGLNGFIGLFGIIVFRATNRYSIVILALTLLFLLRQLTVFTRRWHWLAVAALAGTVTLIGLWDQTPRSPSSGDISRIRDLVLLDGKIVSSLETKLPARAMIFQLPVTGFPEVPPILEMQDYEHFRPYLQSRSLRFSYGSVKGRTRERWQSEAVQFGAARLVSILESYGFSAILINKKAYEARGASLLSELAAAGRSEILCETSDLVCIALHPAANPMLPPEFDRNWSPLEGDARDNWKWSQGNATLILYNGGQTARQAHLSFSLGTLRRREIKILNGTQELYQASLAENQPPEPVNLMVLLPPGRSELRFRTNEPGELPSDADERRRGFNVRNLTIQ